MPLQTILIYPTSEPLKEHSRSYIAFWEWGSISSIGSFPEIPADPHRFGYNRFFARGCNCCTPGKVAEPRPCPIWKHRAWVFRGDGGDFL
jgi:hypothetical protein